MVKRFCSVILTLSLIWSLAAPIHGTAAAAIPEVSLASSALSGSIFAAVNTELSVDASAEGSFASAQATLDTLSAMPSTEEAGISDIITDPATGDTMKLRPLSFPVPQPMEDQAMPGTQYQVQAANYVVGDTRTIPDESNAQRSVRCLYSGLYCTVWGSTTDDAAVRISSSIAKDIADAFDGYYANMVNSFGQWYDADGDGKLAIFCYNIGSDPVGATISAYTAGFYRPTDLISSTGHIGSINFGAGSCNGMSMDCIHLDTYPTMGYSTPLSDIPNAFSTLVHEGQHLINFSNQFVTGSKYCGQMDTWLNEAFSMAAEHMICGSDATATRVRYFNKSYTPGTALTRWNGSLSNYANSYLFGQYLRTRYASLTGTDGNTFFKTLLTAWQQQTGGDPLPLAAELLMTTPEQLVLDFWAAIWLRRDSGDYGFRGESWADGLTPHVNSTISGNSAGIYNGSAKFYTMPAGGFTPSARQNITFLQMEETGSVLPEGVPALTGISVQRSSKTECTLSLTASAAGTLRYLVSGDTVTGRHALTETAPLQAGSNQLTIAVSTEKESVVYLCAQGENGLSASLQSAAVPAYTAPVVASGTCGENLTWTLDETGLLTISGEGNMADYSLSAAVPWNTYRSSIKTVVLEEGVTSISSFVFYRCTGLTTITIPASVTSISYDVFEGCTGLTEVTVAEDNTAYTAVDSVLFNKNMTTLCAYPAGKTGSTYVIPSSVTSIGICAFQGCTGLTEIAIPTSVTSIGNFAFHGCTGLTEITIPASVTSINYGAFYGCTRLAEITVAEDNTAYISVDGVLFTKNRKTLNTYPAGKADSTYAIPASVTSIGSYAFSDCTGLAVITIPASVTATNMYAFAGCSSLTDVYYLGAEEQWRAIRISIGNESLTSAALHYAMIWTAVYGETGQMLQMWEGAGTAVPEALVGKADSLLQFMLDRTTLQPLGPVTPVS